MQHSCSTLSRFSTSVPTTPNPSIEDVNGVSHAFVIESFSVKHHVLTMGRLLRQVPAAVSIGVPGLVEQLAGA